MTENQNPSTPPPTPPPVPPTLHYSPPGYGGPAPDQDARNMAMLCHLLAIFTWFLGPLVIWLIKKDSHPFVDDQGKESLNYWLCFTILAFVLGITSFLCIPGLLLVAASIASIVFAIIGAVRASTGIAYRYPVNIRFIK